MEPQTPKSSNKVGIIIGIIVVLAIVAVVAWKLSTAKTDNSPVIPNPTDNNSTSTDTTPVTDNKSKYKDGTYTQTGTYSSPAGTESVKVTLTIKNDVVTDATFVGGAVNPTSKMMQSQFAAGFKTQVVGKSIDSISLTVVNGSSLTPKGFMSALAKIKAQALVKA